MGKNTIILLLATFLLTRKANEQISAYQSESKPLRTYNADTLKYLSENFIDAKNLYIGQKLSFLIKRLGLEIKKCIPNSPSANLSVVTSCYLMLEDEKAIYVKEASKKIPYIFIIYWKTPLSADSARNLSKKDKAKWTCDENVFYGDKIIENIALFGFPSKEGVPPPLENHH